GHRKGRRTDADRARAGAHAQVSDPIFEKSESNRIGPRVQAVLYPGRDRETRSISLYERAQRLERHRDCRRDDLPGEQIYCPYSASRRAGPARISADLLDPRSPWRYHPDTATVFLIASSVARMHRLFAS